MKPSALICTVIMAIAATAYDSSAVDITSVPDPAIDLPASPTAKAQTAVFAGGCFWCTEAVFEQLEAVTDVVSGYAGGNPKTAQYKLVSAGETDHAEVIRVTYDPTRITYGQLLKIFVTVAHDPTQLNRQGPDVGRQYRSAVFFATEDEKRVVGAYLHQLTQSQAFTRPIATTLEPLEAFYLAEPDHQDFVRLNPQHPYVQQQALPKVEKTRRLFPQLIKSNPKP